MVGPRRCHKKSSGHPTWWSRCSRRSRGLATPTNGCSGSANMASASAGSCTRWRAGWTCSTSGTTACGCAPNTDERNLLHRECCPGSNAASRRYLGTGLNIAPMALSPIPPTDTRALFRPVAAELIPLLRGLTPGDWERPTIAGTWLVRDVAAHVLDVTLRRLSFHRDGLTPPPPSRPINSERDFADFINGLNAKWVNAYRRVSPKLLTDLIEKSTTELA